jgi:hypothetical protein
MGAAWARHVMCESVFRESSWGAVTSNVVLYANKRHQISNKTGNVHSSSGSTDGDNAPAKSQQKRTATAMPSAWQLHMDNRKEARALMRCAWRTHCTSLPSSLSWRQSGVGGRCLTGQDKVDRLRVPSAIPCLIHFASHPQYRAWSTLGDTGFRIAFVNVQTRQTSYHQHGKTEIPICSACNYYSFNDTFRNRLWTTPRLRWLVISLSPRRPGFNSGAVHVRFVVVLEHIFFQ